MTDLPHAVFRKQVARPPYLRPRRTRPGPLLKQRVLLAFAFASTACTGALRDAPTARDGALVREMSEVPWPRQWGPRLSVATREAPCRGVASLTGMRCEGMQPVDVTRSAVLAGKIRARREQQPDADALQAAALLDLISGDTSVSTMRRSISFLETSVRIGPTASRYADLAAARLSYGVTHDDAKALFEGLDAAGQALGIQADDAPARFNYALAVDLLGLDEQATKAWR